VVLSHLCVLRHRGGYWDDAYSQHAVEFPDLEGAPLRKTRGLKLYRSDHVAKPNQGAQQATVISSGIAQFSTRRNA